MRRKLLYGLLILALLVAAAIVVLLLTQDTPAAPPPLTVTAVSSPSPSPAPAPSAGTPEALVRYYLESWNAKDAAAMASCEISGHQDSSAYDFQYDASVEILSCTEQSKEAAASGFNAEWYANPAEIAYVIADFTVHYNDAGKQFYVSDKAARTGYNFWLVRESAGGDWRIAMQGY